VSVVLDASAILAVFKRESGAEIAEPLLYRASISAVNLAEVATKLVDRQAPEAEILVLLDELALDVHPFDRDAALAVATLRVPTRSLGLSLADRACLVLARTLGLPVLTTDRAWAKLELGIEIRVVR
jgi:ribonuclease VapC